jgi:hypothetical protein
VMGEFGLQEVLKQFLGEDRAAAMAPAWVGDRYAVFENSKTGETPLVFRLKLDNSADAEHFFTEFSEALEKKYEVQKETGERSNFLEFHTTSGGVYLRCVAAECLDVEGATRSTFDSIDSAIGWTPAPASGAVAANTVPGVRPTRTASVTSEAAASVR